MALPLSEDRLQSAVERLIYATPRLNDWDVNRIHKLASLGPARRVPCDPHGHSTSPAHHSDIKSRSPSTTTARNNDLVVPGKNILSSKDSSDLRKRKAEKDAPSFRQHIIARPMEGHISSDIGNNSEAAAYLKSREFISSTNEVICSQDKENINPYRGYRRCELKQQALDGSDAKRGLQVSKNLQNVPRGRKVGSLLMKQSSNCRMEARRVLHPHSEDGSIEKVKAVSEVTKSSNCSMEARRVLHPHSEDGSIEQVKAVSKVPPNTADCINRSNGVLGTDRKGKTEESPVQVAKQAISKPSLFGACFEESLDAKIVVEGNQLATSVRKLSSSMNCLAIADRPYGIPTPLAPEEGHKQRENALQSENVQGAFISAPKQYDLDVQAGASAACLSQPATSAPAWSYTIRSTSAPLSTCSTEDSVPPLNPPVLHPSKVRSPVVANDIQKSSQSSSAPAFSEKQPRGTKSPEKQSPAKPPMVEHEMMSAAGIKPSRDDNPLSDAGAGKLIQHLSFPEKRPTNTGEPNLQPKKHGENEYFVWVNGRRYQKLKKAGRGGSSEVYKVIDRDGNIYALKRIKLKGRDYTTACGFYQEIELLTRLQGKSYIIRLIDHEVTDKNLFSNVIDGSHTIRHDAYIYMVLEYGEVDLATMLQEKLKERQQGGKDVDETWLRFYWQQILEAVNTVHEERIIHADLKPANFLLVKGVLKLIDFGIAKSILGDTTNIERDAQVGTLNYMSPEAFLMNEKDEHGNVIKCGRPSDIWALGCILYQMVYGKTPFAHIMALHAKIQEVANPNHKINFPPVSNPYLLDIMKKCLAYKREDRLRIPELLQHPFLQPQMVAQLQPGNSHGKDGARTSCARQVERKILLKIHTEKEQGRDVRALMSLLEEVRLLELCGGPRWPTTRYEGQHDDA